MAERYFEKIWNEITFEELDENINKSTKFCFDKRTKWKYEQKYYILVESLAGLGFGERSIQFCHMLKINKYNHARLRVQLGINTTRDVWKFAEMGSPRRLVQFWQNFQTSLELLIPNCTRHRKITYTYRVMYERNFEFRYDIIVLVCCVHSSY
jgi:hypothetical protein